MQQLMEIKSIYYVFTFIHEQNAGFEINIYLIGYRLY